MTIKHYEACHDGTEVVSIYAPNLSASIEDIGTRRGLNVEARDIINLWLDRGPDGISLTVFLESGDVATVSLFGTDLIDKIKAEVCVSEMHEQEPI